MSPSCSAKHWRGLREERRQQTLYYQGVALTLCAKDSSSSSSQVVGTGETRDTASPTP